MKDYARMSQRRPKSRHTLLPFFVIGSILLGFFLLVMHLWKHPSANKSIAKPEVIAKKIVPTPTRHHEEYAFYRLLPEMQVEVPPPETPVTNTQAKFLLQVASLKRYEDAEHLKESISTFGIPAYIQTITGSTGQVWNRVTAGPFNSRDEATEAQNTLWDNRINSVLIKVTKP